MKRISIKSLTKQISQASDFYSKTDITAEDFFRYTTSPFLAKTLLGIDCSNELFSIINDSLVHDSSGLDKYTSTNIANNIRILDSILKRLYLYLYILLGVLYLLSLVTISYYITEQKTLSNLLTNLGVLALVFVTVGIFVVDAFAKSLARLSISKYRVYKSLVADLKAQYAIFQTGLEYWSNLSWQNFEREVTNKFVKLGYDAINTKFSGDEGVDVVITNGSRKFIVQCKAMKGKVGPAFIRDFIGTIALQKACGGMVITLNGFSDNSLEISNYENLFLLKIQDFLLLEKDQFRKMIGW